MNPGFRCEATDDISTVSGMWNLIATLAILGATILAYTIGMWVTRMINDRGDEILYGVVKGVPVSTKDRWFMLFTNWLPYALFLIGFLLIVAIGNVRIAKVVDDPTVATFGYLCAGFLAMGALFWLVLGLAATFPNMVAAIRKSESVQ